MAAPVGALLALAFAPLGLFPLAVAVPGDAVPAGHGRRHAEAAWRGFLFTGGTFLAGTYWLYHSVHTIGGAPLVVTLFLMWR